MELPEEGMWGHQESECSVSQKASSPSIITSMKSATNLVHVISKSHSPLPVIIFKYVITISKLCWVSLCLFWFETMSSSNIGIVVNIISINSLRWFESLVIESWICSLSSAWLAFSSCCEGPHWNSKKSLPGQLNN